MIKKNWKYIFVKPGDMHDTTHKWGSAIERKEAIKICIRNGDNWDLYDPDSGTCIYRSQTHSKSKQTLTGHKFKYLLCTAMTLGGCNLPSLPDETITQQHIDKAVQLCATNGGISRMQKQGYRFWFTCNNGMNGVVIDKEP